MTAPSSESRLVVFLILAVLFAMASGWIAAAETALGPVGQGALIVAGLAGTLLALIAYANAARQLEAERQRAFQEKLKESEERLRQAQKMEAVGQLAGGIAHDFNNLVTVIGCSVGLISEATAPEDPRQEDLEQIKDAADRAATLTRQLLAFSRRQILQPKPVDLNAVVRDIEKMLQRVIGPHIHIHTALDGGIGKVLADVGQIEQVLMNLAVNARDAMPSGGALMFSTVNRTIPVDEKHRHGVIPPGEYVVLSVHDTGQGMSTQVLEHLFEPFFTTKEYGKGTGLGLATVHGIVYQSGGHITVDSAPGQGTTFTLYFPRIRSDRPVTPASGVRTANRPHRPIVLIVDDEDAILDIGVRVLQQAGFQVFAAREGEEALSVLARSRGAGEPVALVLTDMVMPVMGGRELARLVTSQYPETHVLCMSGYRDDELIRQQLLDPGTRLIHKPFELNELISAVQQTLRLPSSSTATPTAASAERLSDSRHGEKNGVASGI